MGAGGRGGESGKRVRMSVRGLHWPVLLHLFMLVMCAEIRVSNSSPCRQRKATTPSPSSTHAQTTQVCVCVCMCGMHSVHSVCATLPYMYIHVHVQYMYLHYPTVHTCTVGGIEKFPFRFRATVLPFPCNGTRTVVQRWLPFRATLRSV